MSETTKPFIVNDRRKFTLDGEPRPDAPPSKEEPQQQEKVQAAPPPQKPVLSTTEHESSRAIPEGPTPEQIEQSRLAYEATADRLETAVRAANPGADHPPPTSFVQIVQSIYMTAIMQLGGGTPDGQQPQIDLMGARQSIDMLAVLGEKSIGNLTDEESRLLESALFEVRMAFLEITQSLARSAASKAQGPGGVPPPGRPSIVR